MARKNALIRSLSRIRYEMMASTYEADRRSRRQERERLREEEEWDRLDALEQARLEVEAFNDRMGLLTDVHRLASVPIDWARVANAPPPVPPPALPQARKNAASARATDEALQRMAMERYTREEREWRSMCTLATRILARDPAAIRTALEHLGPAYGDIEAVGGRVRLQLADDNETVEACIDLDPEPAVPTEIRALLPNGRSTAKKMPRTKAMMLAQEFACGCALRVAAEALGLVPVDNVLVNLRSEVSSRAGDARERAIILSVRVNRAGLAALDLKAVSPLDAVRRFDHRMDFSRSRGFLPVVPLDAAPPPPGSPPR